MTNPDFFKIAIIYFHKQILLNETVEKYILHEEKVYQSMRG